MRSATLSTAVLAVLAVLAAPGLASAAAEPGAWRIGAAFAGLAWQDLDLGAATDESFTADLGGGGRFRVGYLPGEALELGLGLGVSRRDVELDVGPGFATIEDEVTGLSVLPYVEWRLPLDDGGDWVLAPGLSAGYARTDSDLVEADTFELGASVTLEIFVVERASVDVGVDLGWSAGDGALTVVVQDSFFGGGTVRRDLDIEGWSASGFVGLSLWP